MRGKNHRMTMHSIFELDSTSIFQSSPPFMVYNIKSNQTSIWQRLTIMSCQHHNTRKKQKKENEGENNARHHNSVIYKESSQANSCFPSPGWNAKAKLYTGYTRESGVIYSAFSSLELPLDMAISTFSFSEMCWWSEVSRPTSRCIAAISPGESLGMVLAIW